MPGAAVVYQIDAARQKKEKATSEYPSICPIRRRKQFRDLTPQEGRELFDQLSGKHREDDD